MTRRLLPRWLSGLLLLDALALAAVGLACLLGPHLLFGSEGYRTVARLPIGLLGATALAIGGGLAAGLLRPEPQGLARAVATFLVAAALAPAVMTFNIGALDAAERITGLTAFLAAGAVVLLFGLPAVLALLHLRRARVG